jgi:hypothetical protein
MKDIKWYDKMEDIKWYREYGDIGQEWPPTI